MDPQEKPVQDGTEFPDSDPERMTVEEDGQDAFDEMWGES